MLSSNQIARFFDCQSVEKELNGILDFLYGKSHKRKVATEALTFAQPCPNIIRSARGAFLWSEKYG